MKKRFGRKFFIVSIPTLIFLGLFGGFYLMIRVRYGNFPEDNYYFEGGLQTNAQLLVMNFYDIELMIPYSIIAIILAIVYQIIDDKLLNRHSWIMTAFALTLLLSLMHFVSKLVPTISFDDEYLEIYLIELKEEMIFFVIISFLFSFILTGLLRTVGIAQKHDLNKSNDAI